MTVRTVYEMVMPCPEVQGIHCCLPETGDTPWPNAVA
jgi:hypothetical protein